MEIDSVKVDGKIMLITSCVGLGFNLLNMFVLRYCFNEKIAEKELAPVEKVEMNTVNQENAAIEPAPEGGDIKVALPVEKKEEKPKENMNIRAAYINFLGDFIQAIGVIISAIIIFIKPTWNIADPITSFLFAIIVIMTTLPMIKDCMNILMEYAPEDIDARELFEKILNLECVDKIIDLHVWSLHGDQPCFTVKLTTSFEHSETLATVQKLLEEEYEIYHSTI